MREFVGGEFSATLLDGIDFVAVSPGLMPSRELAAIFPPRRKRTSRVGRNRMFAQALAALKEERAMRRK
jgi:UDP-N-acetylmuramoylalanine--D-glutamate ligase